MICFYRKFCSHFVFKNLASELFGCCGCVCVCASVHMCVIIRLELKVLFSLFRVLYNGQSQGAGVWVRHTHARMHTHPSGNIRKWEMRADILLWPAWKLSISWFCSEGSGALNSMSPRRAADSGWGWIAGVGDPQLWWKGTIVRSFKDAFTRLIEHYISLAHL